MRSTKTGLRKCGRRRRHVGRPGRGPGERSGVGAGHRHTVATNFNFTTQQSSPRKATQRTQEIKVGVQHQNCKNLAPVRQVETACLRWAAGLLLVAQRLHGVEWLTRSIAVVGGDAVHSPHSAHLRTRGTSRRSAAWVHWVLTCSRAAARACGVLQDTESHTQRLVQILNGAPVLPGCRGCVVPRGGPPGVSAASRAAYLVAVPPPLRSSATQ
jgi:hypothetical protein